MITQSLPLVTENTWVESYSPGIWKVSRILRGFYELRYKLSDRKRKSKRIIYMNKRLVDNSWKKSFAAEACDVAQILSQQDQHRLVNYLEENPAVAAEFEEYRLENLNFSMEIRFYIVDFLKIDEFRNIAFQLFYNIKLDGLTNTEILMKIADSPLASLQAKGNSNFIIQFACHNYELRDGEFLFKDLNIFVQ